MALGNPTHVLKITSDETQVPSNQSDFVTGYDLSNAGSKFHSIIHSTGKDLRITTSGGTEVAYNLISLNTGAETGYVEFDGDLSSGAADSYLLYIGDHTLSAYSRTDTYGSENVFPSNYRAKYSLQGSYDGTADEVVDETSNLEHGRGGSNSGDSDPQQDTSGLKGDAQLFGSACTPDDFDTAIDLPTITIASGTDRALQFWVKNDALTTSSFLFVAGTPLVGAATRDAGIIDTPAFYDGAWKECGTAMNTAVWELVTFVMIGTTLKIYIDDTQYGGDLAYTQVALGGTMRLGHNQGGATTNTLDAAVGEGIVYESTVPTADQITTKFNIEKDGSTFWTTAPLVSLLGNAVNFAANF
jgi:hypothetical protein